MKLKTALGLAAGATALGVSAWAVWFGLHFTDTGTADPEPMQGKTGETWWIVVDANDAFPATLGNVLSAKPGTLTEGGPGTTVYVVLLSHDVVLRPGRNVASARRVLSWP